MSSLAAKVNAALDALPTTFELDVAEARAHCASIGIKRVEHRHLMGFGCQVGVYQRLGAQFGSRMSSESRDEQVFDIDVFNDGEVYLDTKARTLGASASWTISRRELNATFPGVALYAFYTFSKLLSAFTLHGALVKAEGGNFVSPRPSQFNDGYFWVVSDIPPGNKWRMK